MQHNQTQIPEDKGNSKDYWWDYTLNWFGVHEPKHTNNKKDNLSKIKELENKNKSIRNDDQYYPSYASYIRPKEILSQQTPVSTNPDERVFIIVHQMYELAFKQIIFDLDIVSNTLNALIGNKDGFKEFVKLKVPVNYEQFNDIKLFSIVQDYFLDRKEREEKWKIEASKILETISNEEEKIKKEIEINEKRESEKKYAELNGINVEDPLAVSDYQRNYQNVLFWQAAYFASNRLIINAEKILSALSNLLDITTFSGMNFSQFRPLLLPASGFQTEQFRTVQMILGKAECFNYKYFGMMEYLKKYSAWEKDEAWKDINDISPKDLSPEQIADQFFFSVIDKRLHQRNLANKENYIRDWEELSPENALKFEDPKFKSQLCINVSLILKEIYCQFYYEYKLTYKDKEIKISKENNSEQVRDNRLSAFKIFVDNFLKNSDPLIGYSEKDNKSKVLNILRERLIGDLAGNIYEQSNEHWDNNFRCDQRIGMQILVDNFRDSFLLHILRNLSILDTTIHGIDHSKRNKERNLRISVINRPYYSFLERHVDFIDNQIGTVMDYERGGAIGGSGGGGKNYFEFAMRLYELFPAFPAVDEFIVK